MGKKVSRETGRAPVSPPWGWTGPGDSQSPVQGRRGLCGLGKHCLTPPPGLGWDPPLSHQRSPLRFPCF